MSEYEYSKFGDFLEGKTGDRPEEISKEWAEIDDDTISDLLLYMDIADIEEDNWLSDILKRKGYNQTITKQLRNGNTEYLRVLRGTDEMGRDISGYRAIKSLENEWLNNADHSGVTKQIWIGEEGAGKTAGALFEATEVAPRVLKAYKGKKVVYAGNVEVKNVDELPLDRAHFINSTSEMDEILEQYGDKPNWEIIFLFDEGDQLLGGFGSSNVTGRAISDRVKLFRKDSAHIIITSQTQVTADLRRNFGDIRYKPDKHNEDRIVVATSIDSNGEVDSEDIKWQATGLPMTNADYETTDKGTWRHDVDGQDQEVVEAQERAQAKQEQLDEILYKLNRVQGKSLRQIEDELGIPKSTVSDRVNLHEERLDVEDSAD